MVTLTSSIATELAAPALASPAAINYPHLEMPPFDPAIHLAFTPPAARHSFTSLNLPKPAKAPDMCVTEPFQLFSDEGIRMIRRDLLRKEVLDKHLTAWERAPCTIAGAEETAIWIRDMWYHPTVTDCISQAFGVPLKILGRRGEVGYVNVQLGPEGVEGVYKLQETPSPSLDVSNASMTPSSGPMTDSWHKDSTQIVVVVMLSDCSTMLGGETAIRTGSGEVVTMRGKKAGSAVVMQGCHTPHAALRAGNVTERISMVTSYSFANPDLDDSGTSLRSISRSYHDFKSVQEHFLLHKLEKMKERVEKAMQEVRESQGMEGSLSKEKIEPWVEEQIKFLKQTSWELFERYPGFLYKDVPDGTLEEYLSNV